MNTINILKSIPLKRWFSVSIISGLLIFCLIYLYGQYGLDTPVSDAIKSAQADSDLKQISQGAYLVRVANCMACHTERGGASFAGGRVMQTEFGDFVTPNITPDKTTGIGNWTNENFWHALHNGRSKDGRLLYPAFPFVNYTHISRADSDAMYAYLQTIAPVAKKNADHRLSFPYNQRALLPFWRAFYFRPGELIPVANKSAEWNRGAYLVRGLGHCSACHSGRNMVGGTAGSADLTGAEMAQTNWYAPSLTMKDELNLPQIAQQELATLLQRGQNARSVVAGPMAEVVQTSLQHWSDADIQAMLVYLQSLPQEEAVPPDFIDKMLDRKSVNKAEFDRMMEQGQTLYHDHCEACHNTDGSGKAGVYPALRASHTVQMKNIANAARIIYAGGFAPVTQGNPRPYGMPPFAPSLSDMEVALVLTYIRNAWGNQAGVVNANEVNPYRTASLE